MEEVGVGGRRRGARCGAVRCGVAGRGGYGTGRGKRGGFCFASEGQKPTETNAVADELSHTLHPILTRNHLCYPTWQHPHPHPKPHPTGPLDTVRRWREPLLHQGEIASKEFGLMATISCGTPSSPSPTPSPAPVKVWLRVKTLPSLFFLCLCLSLSLSKCAIFVLPFLEGSRPSCTAGIVLRTLTDTHTHTAIFDSLSLSLAH